ncbi:MAG: hypothetical protein ACTSUF_02115 [Candidatus Heimdallarchaeaceae archaeon]
MVAAATIMEDIWSTFYTLLHTIKDPDGNNMTWTGSYPDLKITSKSDFPIGVIENADILNLTDLNLNYSTAEAEINITITIYDTNPNWVNKLISDVMDKINDNKVYLENEGLYYSVPLVVSMDSGMQMLDKIKVHWTAITFGFKYVYDR